jgi:hypothetical protein
MPLRQYGIGLSKRLTALKKTKVSEKGDTIALHFKNKD